VPCPLAFKSRLDLSVTGNEAGVRQIVAEVVHANSG